MAFYGKPKQYPFYFTIAKQGKSVLIPQNAKKNKWASGVFKTKGEILNNSLVADIEKYGGKIKLMRRGKNR